MRALEGEEKMKTKNLLKKVAAFGATVALVGSTVAGALAAANIANVKDEFIKNGAFNAYVVVGADAKPIDVAGAVELAAAFANVRVESEAAGTATVSVLTAKGDEVVNNLTEVNLTTGEPVKKYGGFTEYWKYSDDTPIAFENITANGKNATIKVTLKADAVGIGGNGKVILDKNGIEIEMKSNASTMGEGDAINWFGKEYDIIQLKPNESKVVLGAMDEQTVSGSLDDIAAGNAKIVIGEEEYPIVDIDTGKIWVSTSEGDKEVDAGDWLEVNGERVFKVEEVTKGTYRFTVKIQTAGNTITVEDDKAWPLDDRYKTDLEFSGDNLSYIKLTLDLDNDVEISGEKSKFDISGGVGLVIDDVSKSSTFETLVVGNKTKAEVTFSCGSSGVSASDTPSTVFPWLKFTGLDEDNIDNSENWADNTYNYTWVLLGNNKLFKLHCNSTGGLEFYKYTGGTPAWDNYYSGVRTVSGVELNASDGKLSATRVSIKYGTDDYYVMPASEDKVYVNVSGDYKAVDTAYSKYGAKITWDHDYKEDENLGLLTIEDPSGVKTEIEVNLTDGANVTKVTFNGATVSSGSETDDYGTEVQVDYSDADLVEVKVPAYNTVLKIGSVEPEDVQLEVNETKTVGETTLTLKSVGGSVYAPVTVESGVSKLDSDISSAELDRPVILVGGPAVNDLVEELANAGKTMSVDDWREEVNGTRTWEHRAIVDLIEDAFNNQTALVVAGYGGEDTLKAARLLAGYILGENTLFESVNGTRAVIDTESETLVEE